MARTLWNETDRKELLSRVQQLRPDLRPLWGRMNALQMITHLTDWLRMAAGEIDSVPRRKIMRFPVVKHLVIYSMPWPKGVPTAPELLARKASGWDEEMIDLCDRLASFEKLKSTESWPVHPAFGRMSTRLWGALGYRHTDHHLRQFGV